MSENRFVTSSFCVARECVAVAAPADGVVVRSTVSGAEVRFTDAEWEAFVSGVRNGEFDVERLRS
ncbi:DUF397 domain-containing protein [Pseudonocardia sp. NPDC049635]|uniref:DUF397 domain-containing protein n=1 Tax=Pseudonocardia sp. NPDC049635 TaxID=3155506 RepID=UPI0033E79403